MSYYTVQGGKVVVRTGADTVVAAGRAVSKASVETTKVIVDHYEGVEFVLPDDRSGTGGVGLKFSF